MKTLFKTLFIAGLLLVLATLAAGVSIAWLLSDAPGVHLSINGDDVMWSSLNLGDAFGAGLGLLIVVGVMCLVLPLLLLVGLGLPLLIVAGVLAVVVAALLGVGALLGSPLILIALVVWLFVRDRRKDHPPVQTPPAPASPSMSA